jgi:hypothetical protein
LIEACKTRCKESGEAVFNNEKDVNSRRNDNKRVQLSLDKIAGDFVADFKAVLTERLSQLYPTHMTDSMVALLSKARCKAQLAHTDYTPQTLADALPVDDDKMPLACLIALTDGTLFDVWPGAIL